MKELRLELNACCTRTAIQNRNISHSFVPYVVKAITMNNLENNYLKKKKLNQSSHQKDNYLK